MNGPVKSVAGAIFSLDRTQILLVERRDVPVWVLPGGGIDANESSENAIIREILEETGFTVKVERLVGLYIPINRLSKLTHLYECAILKGSPTPSTETRRVQFFYLSHLPKRIPPPFREWIEDAHRIQSPVHKKLHNVNYQTLFLYLLCHPVLVLRFLLARLGMSINS
jgi:8-oxo-dGTP pyrophosphatase MutT (NUDIX family)